MKYWPQIFVMATLLTLSHFLFTGSSEKIEYFVWDLSQNLSFLLLVWGAYKSVNFNHVGAKLICASFFILSLANTICWIVTQHTQAWLPLVSFGIILLLVIIKAPIWSLNAIKCDIWTSDGVYIIFKQPSNFMTWFFSLFGSGIGSCYISVDGKKFFISRTERIFKQALLFTSDHGFCFKLDVKDKEELLSDLGKLVGEPFNLVKSNCLTTLKKPLQKQGISVKTVLPSKYFSEFVKK